MATVLHIPRTADISTVPNFGYSEIPDYEIAIFRLSLLLINKVLPPAVIGVGLVGNILAFLVLRQPQYAKQTTCFYMRTLAIFDTTCLTGPSHDSDDRQL
jgi:hypothetical protein